MRAPGYPSRASETASSTGPYLDTSTRMTRVPSASLCASQPLPPDAALAGPVAEMIHSGEPYHPGFVAEWAADWKLAWEAATSLISSERKRLAYLEQTTARLYRLLEREDHWAALAAIVDNLLAHETLEAEEVEDIVGQWLR